MRELGRVAELQWGLVTTPQAAGVGVSRLWLSRLASAGALERVAQGVYRVAGAPASEHEEILTAWLGVSGQADTTPSGQPAVVVAGAAAARLHGIGDLWLERIDLITPTRRSSRREDIRLRTRQLGPDEVTIVEGVPTLTAARTIADLVEAWTDPSLVADALREAHDRGIVDLAKLADHLSPLAAAHGHGDGAGLRDELLTIAGLDGSAT